MIGIALSAREHKVSEGIGCGGEKYIGVVNHEKFALVRRRADF